MQNADSNMNASYTNPIRYSYDIAILRAYLCFLCHHRAIKMLKVNTSIKGYVSTSDDLSIAFMIFDIARQYKHLGIIELRWPKYCLHKQTRVNQFPMQIPKCHQWYLVEHVPRQICTKLMISSQTTDKEKSYSFLAFLVQYIIELL